MVVSSLNAAWRRTGLRAPVRLPAAGKQIETRSAPWYHRRVCLSKIQDRHRAGNFKGENLNLKTLSQLLLSRGTETTTRRTPWNSVLTGLRWAGTASGCVQPEAFRLKRCEAWRKS